MQHTTYTLYTLTNIQSHILKFGAKSIMEDVYGQCSNPSPAGSPSDEDVILASSCPKKRAGRKKFKETRHPVYRGVRQRNGNKWVCEVRTPTDNSRIWLGTYPTPEMAARAHDVAALALRGRMACLNFADSAWRLPVPASADTRDIQRAAAEAGEAFRPPELSEETTPENDTYICTLQDNVINNNIYEVTVPETTSFYMDEEAIFNMPRLIDSMAEGLMISPPSRNQWGWDDTESECDVSLWNF